MWTNLSIYRHITSWKNAHEIGHLRTTIQSFVVQRDVWHTLSNTDRTFQMLTSHYLDFLWNLKESQVSMERKIEKVKCFRRIQQTWGEAFTDTIPNAYVTVTPLLFPVPSFPLDIIWCKNRTNEVTYLQPFRRWSFQKKCDQKLFIFRSIARYFSWVSFVWSCLFECILLLSKPGSLWTWTRPGTWEKQAEQDTTKQRNVRPMKKQTNEQEHAKVLTVCLNTKSCCYLFSWTLI